MQPMKIIASKFSVNFGSNFQTPSNPRKHGLIKPGKLVMIVEIKKLIVERR